MKTRIEKRISSKNGKEYYVLIVELVPGFEKTCFLDDKEVMILELTQELAKTK